ncbi:hypothetical protein B0H14DRAFT_933807 [Mycena olivaceomarginata]|nr:hypothetical protein B0H14DRAFT_933807 [Mycena olivaceomarginata]
MSPNITASTLLFEVPPIRSRFGPWEIVTINFLHTSFGDYLSDTRRSKRWCISLPWLDEECIYRLLYLFRYKPPQTDTQRDLYEEVSDHLSSLLENATPSEALVDLLRNHSVQNHLFLNGRKDSWPKRGPPYPPDLVQLWDDLRAVARLRDHLHVSKDPSASNVQVRRNIYRAVFPTPGTSPHLTMSSCGSCSWFGYLLSPSPLWLDGHSFPPLPQVP